MRNTVNKTVYISCDHAGLTLKKELVPALKQWDWTVEDLGTDSKDSCDYPDFAHTVCCKVLQTEAFGILICGTGIGMSMAANRHKGIRAALCTHEYHARATREHNNANVLCLGERITAPALAVELARIFLTTPYAEGRHQKRIDKLDLWKTPSDHVTL